MRNLSNILKEDRLYFWSNSIGDIFLPGSTPLHSGNPSGLPPAQRELYEGWQSKEGSCNRYVVSFNGKPAMAFGFIFDEDFIARIMGLDRDDPNTKDLAHSVRGVLFRAIKAYARYVENSFPWTGIEALAGEDIEGSAHELYLIVPYEKRKQIDRVDQFLVDAFFEVARNFSSLLVQATEKMGYCVEGEERATNRKPKYIITNTPGLLAVELLSDLENGSATANGDRSSQYFRVAHGSADISKEVSVALIEYLPPLKGMKEEGYYGIHIVNNVSDESCDLEFTDDLSEEGLVKLLTEILYGLENKK